MPIFKTILGIGSRLLGGLFARKKRRPMANFLPKVAKFIGGQVRAGRRRRFVRQASQAFLGLGGSEEEERSLAAQTGILAPLEPRGEAPQPIPSPAPIVPSPIKAPIKLPQPIRLETVPPLVQGLPQPAGGLVKRLRGAEEPGGFIHSDWKEAGRRIGNVFKTFAEKPPEGVRDLIYRGVGALSGEGPKPTVADISRRRMATNEPVEFRASYVPSGSRGGTSMAKRVYGYYDYETGEFIKARRRRRRRLLTSSDISDISALAAIVGKGELMKSVLAGRMRCR